MTNRRLPSAVPVWSGWATMLGLHSAAPSMAYSLVNAAPNNTFRASESCGPGWSRSASTSACLRNVPIRSRCRPSKRVMTSSSDACTSSLGERQDAPHHHTRPGVLKLEAFLAGYEELVHDP